MDEMLAQQIKQAEKKGWKLCAGCYLKSTDSPLCRFCPISQRKLIGIPPVEKQPKPTPSPLGTVAMDRLKCGCVPGRRSCPRAEALWAAANAAYEAWRAGRDEGDWARYREAYLRYDAHVGES